MKMKVRTCQVADPEKVRNIIDLCIKRLNFIPVCSLAITRSLDSLLQIVQEVYKLSQCFFSFPYIFLRKVCDIMSWLQLYTIIF